MKNILNVNYYTLFFAVLFLNNWNVVYCSYRQPLPPEVNLANTNTHTQQEVTNESNVTVPSEKSFFPSFYQYPGTPTGICPLPPINSSITPQPYNWHFNCHSSTSTFMSPLMFSNWNSNHSNNTFASTLPLFVRDTPLPSTNTDIFANTDNNTNSPYILSQESAHTKEQAMAEKKKHTQTYVCLTCNKKLASRSSFNYHLKTHDPNRPRPYRCNLCYKNFAEKSILKNHMNSHNNEKPFKCGICQKGLSSKVALENHLNGHRGRKPYTCEKCKKSFRQKGRLKEHLKLHKDKTPYRCGKCTKAYTTKDGLKYHLNTHNRPKPYTCHYCGDGFADQRKYKSHMRYEEETDEERKCHICKKVYSEKYNLIKHKKKVHAGI